MIAARNGWVLAYDNLSGIPDWLSDGLCRLATGGGLSTRRLYENDVEEIFEAKRPIIINGIEAIATRSDLVDRALIIDLPPIPAGERLTEAELDRELEQLRPGILGALLDAVSCGLHNLPNTKLDSLPRLADFAKWITACEPALGWESGSFLEAYDRNRKGAIQTSLEADLVAVAIQDLMTTREEWEGTPTELLSELETHTTERQLKAKDWPKVPNKLTGRLKRCATFLRASGIDIRFGKSHGRRIVAMRKRYVFYRLYRPDRPPNRPGGR